MEKILWSFFINELHQHACRKVVIREKKWFNMVAVLEMARRWLRHWEREGSMTWDEVMSRLMSVASVSRLGFRSVDILQRRLHQRVPNFKWSDVEITTAVCSWMESGVSAAILVTVPQAQRRWVSKRKSKPSQPIRPPPSIASPTFAILSLTDRHINVAAFLVNSCFHTTTALIERKKSHRIDTEGSSPAKESTRTAQGPMPGMTYLSRFLMR